MYSPNGACQTFVSGGRKRKVRPTYWATDWQVCKGAVCCGFMYQCPICLGVTWTLCFTTVGTVELMKSYEESLASSCEHFIHKLIVIQRSTRELQVSLTCPPQELSKHWHVLPAGTDVQTGIRPAFLRTASVNCKTVLVPVGSRELIWSAPDVQYLRCCMLVPLNKPGRQGAFYIHQSGSHLN